MNPSSFSADAVATNPRLRPQALAAVIQAAKRRDMATSDWLNEAVFRRCIEEAHPQSGTNLLFGDATCELFATVADCSPELLRGEWSRLYETVRADRSVWVYPHLTVGEFEDGVSDDPYIHVARLRKVWPMLVAEAGLAVNVVTPDKAVEAEAK